MKINYSTKETNLPEKFYPLYFKIVLTKDPNDWVCSIGEVHPCDFNYDAFNYEENWITDYDWVETVKSCIKQSPEIYLITYTDGDQVEYTLNLNK